MLISNNGIQFQEKLSEKLIEYGVKAINANSISVSLQEEQNTVTVSCNSVVYRDIFVSIYSEIQELAKIIYNKNLNIVFQLVSAKHKSESKKHSESKAAKFHSTHKESGSKEKSPCSIFDFNAQEAEGSSAVEEGKEAATTNSDEVADLTDECSEDKKTSKKASANGVENTELQSDMTFSSFVRGQSNTLAYSACEGITKHPGKVNNPVFIYGDTGLGKTHLLHSVGNELLRRHPTWNILYIPSIEFVTAFIQSVRFKKAEFFRDRYLSCDVLLVDDIQFLHNKEQTQLEFFNIFNLLCNRKKQIVITSDKYPKDIPDFSDRLKSRFLQGLLADIEPPCYEERIAIIQAKAELLSLKLGQEVIEYIATHVKNNVREIQGALNNLMMKQTMTGMIPTIESTAAILKGMVKMQKPTIDISTIQKCVANHYCIKLVDLISSSRAQKLVIPRHIAMYLSRELVGANLTEIASSFGRKDHTTVLNAIENVNKLLEKDASSRADISDLKRKLEQSHN